MNITPALGIGDLLIWKYFQINKNFEINSINLDLDLIYEYKSTNPEKNIEFLKYFIFSLFSKFPTLIHNKIQNIDYCKDYGLIKNIYLYPYYNFATKEKDMIKEKYIIIHTKLRMDNYIDEFITKEYNKLDKFCNEFITDYTIVLMGERELEQNKEVKIHKIISCYESLIKLSKNNKVIDLTKEFLSSGAEPNDFENDLHIINKAKCNITFGYGGPFIISQSFSKNTLSFIGNISHESFEIFQNLIRNFDDFTSIIIKRYQIKNE